MMKGYIDFHTHILPGIDDGSVDLEMSVAMLQAAWQQGITTVVATPHFYAHNDRPDAFLSRRREAECRLRDRIKDLEQIPDLKMGAEVYYFPGISDSDLLSELTIDGKRCILIEMPMHQWTDGMYRELEGIYVKQGLTPIVAHLDRYLSPFHTRGILTRLEQLPVLVQVNTSFFLRKRTRSLAMKLLRKDRIHLLGSDCHDLDLRPPIYQDAVDIICRQLGDESIERIHFWETEVLCEENS